MTESKNGSGLPAKIMAGLAVCVVLGMGLCGLGGVSGNKAQGYFFVAGALCFWGGLLLLILFGVGWAVAAAIGKSLSGKKD